MVIVVPVCSTSAAMEPVWQSGANRSHPEEGLEESRTKGGKAIVRSSDMFGAVDVVILDWSGYKRIRTAFIRVL